MTEAAAPGEGSTTSTPSPAPAGSTPDPAPWLRGAPWLLWAVGLLLAFHPTLLSGFGRAQTDPGDTRLNNYVLEHALRWAVGDPLHAELWSPRFFFPHPNVGAYTDIELGAAPIYAVWRALGLAPDTAFQLWTMSVASLDFLACWLWLRRGLRPTLPLGALPAAVGAFLLAFGAPRVSQMGHQQLLPQFFSIAAVYALTRLFGPAPAPASRLGPGGWLAVLFASVALQLWASWYLGWFLVTGLYVAGLWALALSSPRRALFGLLRRSAGALLLAALASAIVLAPYVSHYLVASREAGQRIFEIDQASSPRLLSWLYLGPDSWLHGWQQAVPWFRDIPVSHEQRLGLGVVASALAVGGLWSARHARGVAFLGLVAVTLVVVVTVYPGDLIPWRWLRPFVPGAGAIRHLSRIGLLLLIPAALGAAIALERRRSPRVAVLLAALCVAEQAQTTPSYDKEAARAHVRAIVHELEALRGPDCPAFYLSVQGDAGAPPEQYQLDAMWASLESGVPTVNGYSGNLPPGWLPLFFNRTPSAAEEVALRGCLYRWCVSTGVDPARLCWLRMPLDPPY